MSDFVIIDAHLHLWEKQDGCVKNLPVRSLGNGKSSFLGGVHQMMPPYMVDNRNTAELLIANMDYARVNACAVTQEYLDGNQDAYLLKVKEKYPDRFRITALYEDEGYIARFRLLLEAVKTHRKTQVIFDSHRGFHNNWTVIPYRLEYSSTDDKFRLLCHSKKWSNRTLNLSRISFVRLWGTFDPDEYPVPKLTNESLTLEITNERNALERAMLQFSYLAKRTEKIDENTYRMTLHYRQEDETELVIKIISFGPLVRVVEPDRFAALIRERIEKQFRYNLT